MTNPSGGFLQPDVAYTLGDTASRRPAEASPRLGEHTGDEREHEPAPRTVTGGSRTDRMPFEGLRVADFTAFWAGPIVGHYLAMLGADVVHVESVKRPDGMRGHRCSPRTTRRGGNGRRCSTVRTRTSTR